MILCAGLPLVAGCALFPMGRFHAPEDASASGGVDGDAAQTADQADGAAPDPAGGVPGSSMPQAIPDPLHPLAHAVGDSVEVGGATVTFLGIERAGDQFRARFDVKSGSLTDAQLMASGEVVDLHSTAGDLVSDPFGSAASPPAKSAHLILKVGDRFYLFEAGTAP